ncbi:MAG: hypothetical protein JNM03_17825 [Sphingopyxis sp.]|uniref:hypothetical protein n=1 Tax=Sphingopyxis sp. TaxID=1908224 RepID=UPI001A4F6E81|nr:hypothetical protein [Sphingopyxis sp.]MBL9071845.1 hypothetical protein [Sphingopyxis sp.]
MTKTATEPTPQEIADALSDTQRDIVACGPTSFEEAEAIPEDLFTCGEIWESDSGDEWLVWEPTELGLAVRELLAGRA